MKPIKKSATRKDIEKLCSIIDEACKAGSEIDLYLRLETEFRLLLDDIPGLFRGGRALEAVAIHLIRMYEGKNIFDGWGLRCEYAIRQAAKDTWVDALRIEHSHSEDDKAAFKRKLILMSRKQKEFRLPSGISPRLDAIEYLIQEIDQEIADAKTEIEDRRIFAELEGSPVGADDQTDNDSGRTAMTVLLFIQKFYPDLLIEENRETSRLLSKITGYDEETIRRKMIKAKDRYYKPSKEEKDVLDGWEKECIKTRGRPPKDGGS